MSGSHYKQVCEQCGGVVAQCRCMSCDKAVVVKGLCAKCAAQPQDKGSAGQQSASPCNNARDEICPQCTKYALIIRDNYKLCTKCGYVSSSGQTSPVA